MKELEGTFKERLVHIEIGPWPTAWISNKGNPNDFSCPDVEVAEMKP